MPVAIETVIIVIVVVSCAVLGAVVFALYWLWRLLLEDRRCNRLPPECRGAYIHPNPLLVVGPVEPNVPDESHVAEEPDRALLDQRTAGRFPRITRRSDVIVDERGRGRMGRTTRSKRERGVSTAIPPPMTSVVDIQDVIVIDDTEPPPPYEAVRD